MTDNSERISLADIRQAQHELEQLGLLRKTGELRDGRPVYVITELGCSVADLQEQEDAPVCSGCGKSGGVIETFMVTNPATGSDVVEWMHEDCFVALPLVPKA